MQNGFDKSYSLVLNSSPQALKAGLQQFNSLICVINIKTLTGYAIGLAYWINISLHH